MRTLRFAVFALLLTLCIGARAGVTTAAAAPKLQVITGHVPKWASPTADLGVMPAMPMKNLTLVMARPAAKEAAFDKKLDAISTPGSPEYHHFLTQQQVGEQYGPAMSDVNAVQAWLMENHLQVQDVSADRMRITFSGNSADIARAFGTEFHRYKVLTRKGAEERISVVTDPKLPVAIVHAVAAINGLATEPLVSDEQAVEYPTGTNLHLMTAANFNEEYNVPTNYDGTGVRVAIIGQSRVNAADITDYQTEMALNVNAQPNTIIPTGGTDPGVSGPGEQTLDVNRVMSVAPGAWVDLIVSGGSTGLYTAAAYNVNTLLDPVMTMSYGGCEQVQGSAVVATWTSLFQTAASEGITVLVSSGDSGAECGNAWSNNNPNSSNPAVTTTPTLGINWLCSDPYVTCVGGTSLTDTTVVSVGFTNSTSQTATNATATATVVNGVVTAITPVTQGSGYTSAPTVTIYGGPAVSSGVISSTSLSGTGAMATAVLTGDKVTSYTVTAGGSGYPMPSTYWSDTGTTFSTLLSYIPEGTFDEPLEGSGYLQVGGSNGGPALYTIKPSWQSTSVYIPTALKNDGQRDVPDIALMASGHDGFFQCINLDCESSKYTVEKGTSAAAPSLAGMMALIVQKFGKMGNFNPTLYSILNQGVYGSPAYRQISPASGGVATCVASVPSPCNNSEPYLTGYTTNTTGYSTVTGVGSIDLSNFLNFGGALTTATSGYAKVTTTFGTQSAVAAGSALSATGNLNATAKTTSTDVTGKGVMFYTATSTVTGSAPVAVTSASTLVAGNYTLRAYWQPDAADAASYNVSSGTTSVTVSKATPTVPTVSLTTPSSTTFPVGTTATLSVTISGSDGTPTGSVQFYDGSTAIGAAKTLDNTGKATLQYQFNAAESPASIKATYSGDTNYTSNVTSTNALSLTVVSTTPTVGTVSLTSPSSTTFAVGTTASFSVTVSGASGTPTGMVQFYNGSTAIGAAQTLSNTGVATLNYQFTATGSPSITASYGGDITYIAGASSTALALTVSQASLTVSANPTSLTITRGQSGTSLFTFTPNGAYTGTVALSCTGLPAYATCQFSSQPAFNNSSTIQTSTLTIFTLAPSAVSGPASSGLLWIPAAGLGMLLLFGRRKVAKRVQAAVFMALLACVAIGITGCTKTSYGTPTGTSSVQVVVAATATASTSLNNSNPVTLTVTIQ